MPIGDYSKEKPQQLIDNYRRKDVTEGGPYTLAEARLEQMRRTPSRFDGPNVFRKIVEFSRSSTDQTVTYLQIWDAFSEEPWKANYSIKLVGAALERVAYYCFMNNLPFFNILVVRKSRGKLGESAIKNIYTYYRELGVDVGLDPDAFISREMERCRAYSQHLPAAAC
jgi:hypothetical protein